MPRCNCKVPCHHSVKQGVSWLLCTYGKFVGTHPIPFIIGPILLFGGLSVGLVTNLTIERDPNVLYYPRDNRASKEEKQLLKIFQPFRPWHYTDFSVVVHRQVPEATVIFEVKDSGRSLFDDAVAEEIIGVLEANEVGYNHTCVRLSGACVEYGQQFVGTQFRYLVNMKQVKYPDWTDPRNNRSTCISFFLAGVKVEEKTKVMISARLLKVRYVMNEKSYFYQNFVKSMGKVNLKHTVVYYEHLESVSDELTRAVEGDKALFVGTVLIIIVYSSLVTVGGDVVSTRALLAIAGVLATALGILGAIGFLCLLGVDFAIINFVVPFLLIGIGVDDMFLLMSSWSETLHQPDLSVPDRVSMTLSVAGVGMTVTSLTDFLAFMIGYSSVFFSVRNFCLYAGVAVLFVYISHLTLFAACLSLHGRRVYSGRHCLTCHPVTPRQRLREEGKSAVYSYLCGGHPPHRPRDDESMCEKVPRMFIPRLANLRASRYVVPLLFASLLAVSIYGAVNIKQGLDFKDLVLKSSYYYDFITTKNKYFPAHIPIGFHFIKELDYTDTKVQEQVKDLLKAAKKDQDIMPDFEQCWMTAFLSSPFYGNETLPVALKRFVEHFPMFYGDIIIDKNDKIVASRCSVLSHGFREQYGMANLMVRMREVAEKSPLPVIAYQQSFELFEQYLATLPATLQTVGCAILAMVVVCSFLLPHPFMVALTTLNIMMITVNIFGFMYFLDITLSSVTMIHLVMSVGFAVDFSAHVCSAYLMSNSFTRKERAFDAITHAASPILNGGISSLVGVLLLATSEAYVFSTFFKIMCLVMIFGILNSVVFLPVILTLFGPEQHVAQDEKVGPDTKANDRGFEPAATQGVNAEGKFDSAQGTSGGVENIDNMDRVQGISAARMISGRSALGIPVSTSNITAIENTDNQIEQAVCKREKVSTQIV
ncbi:patched domain-containing protein 3-like [Littorina saxatilis]|uniref:patched domain-containing protein 3-like n=1 Tax=Littorina saxatilis TaxID=31220 RepID=UPI0038B4F9D0